MMRERGTLKIKLGEVLGIKSSATSQAKAERANRFLTARQKSISIDELNALTDFFQVPVSFWLQAGAPARGVAQSTKAYKTVNTNLEKSLDQLGLTKEERASISTFISLLKKHK